MYEAGTGETPMLPAGVRRTSGSPPLRCLKKKARTDAGRGDRRDASLSKNCVGGGVPKGDSAGAKGNTGGEGRGGRGEREERNGDGGDEGHVWEEGLESGEGSGVWKVRKVG